MHCRYESAKEKGEYDEEALKREHAKHALERYMHYYHRWAENDKAKKAAARKMKSAQQETLEILSNFYATPTSQLKFILDAWNQVKSFSCRLNSFKQPPQASCISIAPFGISHHFYGLRSSFLKRKEDVADPLFFVSSHPACR